MRGVGLIQERHPHLEARCKDEIVFIMYMDETRSRHCNPASGKILTYICATQLRLRPSAGRNRCSAALRQVVELLEKAFIDLD